MSMFRICALAVVMVFAGACSSSKDHSAKTTDARPPSSIIQEPQGGAGPRSNSSSNSYSSASSSSSSSASSSTSSSSSSSGSSSSTSSSGVVVAPVTPRAPENLRVAVVDHKIVYAWDPVTGAEEYILYYSTTPEVTPSDTGIRWLSTRSPELVFDSDEKDVYYAVVTAVTAGGIESEPSNQVQASVDDEPVLTIDFDDEPVGSVYELKVAAENKDLVIGASDGSSNHYLSATYVPTSIGSPRLRFTRQIPPESSYTLNYKVFFESGFDFAKGGKLPGLSPAYPTVGCEELDPGGWSVRLMWIPEGGVSVYYYDQELTSNCGNDSNARGFRFQRERWYDIAIYVKLNTPPLKDGQISLYINGLEVVALANLNLRAIDGPDTEIQKLLFSTFFGGNSSAWSPSSEVMSRFDQFEIYRGLHVRSPL
jgi:hypothetical protein